MTKLPKCARCGRGLNFMKSIREGYCYWCIRDGYSKDAGRQGYLFK